MHFLRCLTGLVGQMWGSGHTVSTGTRIAGTEPYLWPWRSESVGKSPVDTHGEIATAIPVDTLTIKPIAENFRRLVALLSERSVSYSRHMVAVLTTQVFDRWLSKLKDRQARLRIVERIDRLTHGNLGDTKSVGEGVWELRMTYGPGYRVYYLQDGDTLIPLPCGGDKVHPASGHRPGTPTRRRMAL